MKNLYIYPSTMGILFPADKILNCSSCHAAGNEWIVKCNYELYVNFLPITQKSQLFPKIVLFPNSPVTILWLNPFSPHPSPNIDLRNPEIWGKVSLGFEVLEFHQLLSGTRPKNRRTTLTYLRQLSKVREYFKLYGSFMYLKTIVIHTKVWLLFLPISIRYFSLYFQMLHFPDFFFKIIFTFFFFWIINT